MEAMSVLKPDECDVDLTQKTEAPNEDGMKQIIVDYVFSYYGIRINKNAIKINDRSLNKVYEDTNYIVKDKLLDTQFKRYSFKILAGALYEEGKGWLASVEFNSSFEYATGGSNGHRIYSMYDEKRGWREQ